MVERKITDIPNDPTGSRETQKKLSRIVKLVDIKELKVIAIEGTESVFRHTALSQMVKLCEKESQYIPLTREVIVKKMSLDANLNPLEKEEDVRIRAYEDSRYLQTLDRKDHPDYRHIYDLAQKDPSEVIRWLASIPD